MQPVEGCVMTCSDKLISQSIWGLELTHKGKIDFAIYFPPVFYLNWELRKWHGRGCVRNKNYKLGGNIFQFQV